MRPMLKAALRRSWRGRESVQFGVDPERAVVLEPVDGPEAGLLDLLDGTRGGETLLRDAAALGVAPDRVRRLLGVLAQGGVLDDAAAHTSLSGAVRHRTAALDRLRPDLAALSLLHPAPGEAAARIRHRRTARVRVHGAGRVGAQLAAVVSAAGVGAVDLIDTGRVDPWDAAPGGIPAEHIHDRRDAAGRGAVRRAAPDLKGVGGPPRSGGGGGPGHVVAVLAPRDGLGAYAPDAALSRRLVAAGVAHLYAGVVEGLGVVGPLVVPGRTSCGECLALRLADADPAWPRMLAQLRPGRQPAVPACDIAQATAVAGLAAAHVLAHLDGRAAPTLGARVELPLARLSTRVRVLPPHPRCGCGAAAAADGGTAGGGGAAADREAGRTVAVRTSARTPVRKPVRKPVRAGTRARVPAGAPTGAGGARGPGVGPRGGRGGGRGGGTSADGADRDKASQPAATGALLSGPSVGRGTMAR